MKKMGFEKELSNEKRNAEFRNRVTEVLFNTGYPDYALVMRAFRQVVPVRGKLIGMTDYNNLYINEELTDDELSVVVRHEILHVMLRHNKRAPKGRKRMMWNMACDYELSHYYSVYDNHVIANSEKLHDACYIARHVKYGNKTAKQIYDALVLDFNKQKEEREKQEREKLSNMPSNPASGNEDIQDGDIDFNPTDVSAGDPNDDVSEKREEYNEPDLSDEFDDDTCTTEDGEAEDQIDNNIESEDAENDMMDEAGDNEFERGEFDDNDEFDPFEDFDSDDITEEMRENAEKEAEKCFDDMDLGDESDAELEEQLRKAMELALKVGYDTLTEEQKEQMENSELVDNTAAGKSGLGVKMDPPKLDEAVRLKYQLKSYFIKQEQVDKGRTYRRPNKKYAGSSFIVKGKANVYKPSKTIACYVDVSGSMTKNMVKRALEVVEGLKKIKRLEVKIHYFNTKIHDEFWCGGGTDYREVLDHATKNKYSCIAIITDNSSESWYVYKWEFEAIWLIGVQKSYGKPYAFERAVEAVGHPAKDKNWNGEPVIKCKKFQYNEVLPII